MNYNSHAGIKINTPENGPSTDETHKRAFLSRLLCGVAHAAPMIVAGFTVSYITKSALMLSFGAAAAGYALPVALTASATAGIAVGTLTIIQQRRALANDNAPFFSRKNTLKLAFHAASGMAGGALGFAFSDQIASAINSASEYVQSFFGAEQTAPIVTPPIEQLPPENLPSDPAPLEPVPEPAPAPIEPPATEGITPDTPAAPDAPVDGTDEPGETDQTDDIQETLPPTALELAAQALNGNGQTTSALRDTLARASSGNAQAIKDLGYFFFNGFGGVKMDQSLALQLFEMASDMGNVQAKVDLAYIEYHGLAGVDAAPRDALEDMRALTQDRRARDFVRAWGKVPTPALT